MNAAIGKLQTAIESYRQQIIRHKVYGVITDINRLNIFLQHHVFTVWDFMSLLKSLQIQLTCTSVPWFPVGDAGTRYLINEIVAGEESDVDGEGVRKSHFELYLDAMQQSGANSSTIQQFLASLKQTGKLEMAFDTSAAPASVRRFVSGTFDVINSGKSHVQSAVFTFGREDLIPGMFVSLVNDINRQFPNSVSIFKYYLDRHIEVDGGHHSQLALQMTASLCGDNAVYWEEVEAATIRSLQQRIELWNGIYDEVMALPV